MFQSEKKGSDEMFYTGQFQQSQVSKTFNPI